MTEMIARCGFKCHRCGAFIDNNKTPEDQARIADAWKKYFGLVVVPETIRCNGCLAHDRGANEYPSKNCPIAPCVVARGIHSCADCAEYPCKNLEELMRSCDKVIQRFRGVVPGEEFERFIAPYDCHATLNAIRRVKGLDEA